MVPIAEQFLPKLHQLTSRRIRLKLKCATMGLENIPNKLFVSNCSTYRELKRKSKLYVTKNVHVNLKIAHG